MNISQKKSPKLLAKAILLTSITAVANSPAFALELEEIVVTAQKREQSLQSVPIAISALQPDALAQRGVDNVEDLGLAVPGLVISNQLFGVAPIIRGIGQANLAPGAELGVATYIDGVYIGSSTGSNLGLGNIERIEVLRGPQGTLFGRNATGGLLHIITQTPNEEFSGTASLSVSDPTTVEANVYVTGALSDNVAASFATVIREQSDGYGKNLATGADTYTRDEVLYRGKVLINLSDDSSLTLAADYSDLETDFGLTRRYSDESVDANGVSTPVIRPDGVPNPPGFWDVNVPHESFATNEQWGVSATFDQSLSAFDTKIIAAYRELKSLVDLEQSWTFLQLVDFVSPAEEETFTLEAQILSNDSSSFEWILGGFYLDAKPSIVDITAITAFGTGGFVSNASIDTQSTAVFGQATFELSDAANLTVGARWTEDEKELNSTATGVSFGGAVLTASDSDSWTEMTYRIALDYAFSDDTLGYISYNTGFKSGIFNLFALPLPAGPAVEPEEVTTIEVGLKTDLLNGRLRLNGALYHNDYTDIQLQTTIQGLNLLTNAGEATTYGGELEATYVATDNMQIYINAAYTHTEYDEFNGAQFFVPNQGQCTDPASAPLFLPVNCPSTGNAAGNQFTGIPELTFNIGIIYEAAIANGTAGFSANYFWSDERAFGFNNAHFEDAYNVVTAEVFYRFGSDEQHELRVFGNNLTEEEYVKLYQASTINTVEDPAAGRSIGISYTINF